MIGTYRYPPSQDITFISIEKICFDRYALLAHYKMQRYRNANVILTVAQYCFCIKFIGVDDFLVRKLDPREKLKRPRFQSFSYFYLKNESVKVESELTQVSFDSDFSKLYFQKL